MFKVLTNLHNLRCNVSIVQYVMSVTPRVILQYNCWVKRLIYNTSQSSIYFNTLDMEEQRKFSKDTYTIYIYHIRVFTVFMFQHVTLSHNMTLCSHKCPTYSTRRSCLTYQNMPFVWVAVMLTIQQQYYNKAFLKHLLNRLDSQLRLTAQELTMSAC